MTPNPLVDLSLALAVAAVAVLGSLAVLPRPKPAPVVTDCEQRKQSCPPVFVSAEPKSPAERVRDIDSDVRAIAAEQKKLAQELRALAIAKGQSDQ